MRYADPRLDAASAFAVSALGRNVRLVPASSDASFRRYFRAHRGDESFIVMDAPPEREAIAPWLDIAARLRAAGLAAPEVLASDPAQGFILMSDLGDRLYLPLLDDRRVAALYGDALGALETMQRRVDVAGLPDYDAERLRSEMALMPTWFLERHLGVAPGCDGWELIEHTIIALTVAALEQPRAFVHRDYHSRNLLALDGGSGPGIIDFQDAVRGPVTYDLASLLRDCYIAWPRERVEAWAEAYRVRAVAAGLTTANALTWRRWFDMIGLQRHIKVLGIFCRLWYRDGKSGYLADLPRVLGYVLDVAAQHRETREFARWLGGVVAGRDITVDNAAGNNVKPDA